MFSSSYQSGEKGVEIINPSGNSTNQPNLLKKSGNIQKEYDRDIKGYKFNLNGAGNQHSTIFQCPAMLQKDTLGLTQALLVFQLKCNVPHNPFNLEIVILDTTKQRRRFHISSTFRLLETNTFHVQIPWVSFGNHWTNIVFDLNSMTTNYFGGIKFASIDSFSIRPICCIRKIFTIPRSAISNNESSVISGKGVTSSTSNKRVIIANNFDFPIDTPFVGEPFLYPSTIEDMNFILTSKQSSTVHAVNGDDLISVGLNLNGGLSIAGQKKVVTTRKPSINETTGVLKVTKASLHVSKHDIPITDAKNDPDDSETILPPMKVTSNSNITSVTLETHSNLPHNDESEGNVVHCIAKDSSSNNEIKCYCNNDEIIEEEEEDNLDENQILEVSNFVTSYGKVNVTNLSIDDNEVNLLMKADSNIGNTDTDIEYVKVPFDTNDTLLNDTEKYGNIGYHLRISVIVRVLVAMRIIRIFLRMKSK